VGSAGAGWARLCLARGSPGLYSPHDGRPQPLLPEIGRVNPVQRSALVFPAFICLRWTRCPRCGDTVDQERVRTNTGACSGGRHRVQYSQRCQAVTGSSGSNWALALVSPPAFEPVSVGQLKAAPAVSHTSDACRETGRSPDFHVGTADTHLYCGIFLWKLLRFHVRVSASIRSFHVSFLKYLGTNFLINGVYLPSV